MTFIGFLVWKIVANKLSYNIVDTSQTLSRPKRFKIFILALEWLVLEPPYIEIVRSSEASKFLPWRRTPINHHRSRACSDFVKVACMCSHMMFQAAINGWSSSTASFLSSWSRFLASKEGFQSRDTVFRVGYGLLRYCSFVMLLMQGCSSDFINFSGRSRSCVLRNPDRTPFSFSYSWI